MVEVATKVALIGLGKVHHVHAAALSGVAGFMPVTAFDSDESKPCLLPGVMRAQTLREVLEDVDVGCAIIAVPTSVHAQLAAEIVTAGKDIIVEKPLGCSLIEYGNVYDVAESASRLCFVALHDAYGEEVRFALQGALRSNWGCLREVTAEFSDPYLCLGQLEERHRSLSGSWLDSGVNALSVIAQFVSGLVAESATMCYANSNVAETADVRTTAIFRGLAADEGCQPVTVTIRTSWLEAEARKATVLRFDRAQVELDHRLRRVRVIQPTKDQVFDFAAEGSRLVAQYRSVFKHFAASVVERRDNREFSAAVHQPLLSVFESPLHRVTI